MEESWDCMAGESQGWSGGGGLGSRKSVPETPKPAGEGSCAAPSPSVRVRPAETDSEDEDAKVSIGRAESRAAEDLVTVSILEKALYFFSFLRRSLRGSLPLRRRSFVLGFFGLSASAAESENCFGSSGSASRRGTSTEPEGLIFAHKK